MPKSLDSCQPAWTAQADMGRYFFANELKNLFTETNSFSCELNTERRLKFKEDFFKPAKQFVLFLCDVSFQTLFGHPPSRDDEDGCLNSRL